MTNKKITNLQIARQEKRDKTGWTLEEIKKRAEEERERYKNNDLEEPDALASGGDMSKILEEDDK
ncbi:MAG: hypothetical protein ACRBBR_02620 [Cellvibrionaceae bacterium]